MRRIVTLSLLVLVFCLTGRAQQKYFPEEKSAFLEQLKTYLGSSTSKEDKASAEAMMQDFENVWLQDIGQEDTQKAIGFYELMHAKSGARAYYNIFTFTEVLLNARRSGMRRDDLHRLITFTVNKFPNRLNNLDKYLQHCREIFSEWVLGEKGAMKWMVQNAEFHFPTDTAFLLEVPSCSLMLKSPKDQSVIHDTKGMFLMDDHLWIGQGGKVDWARFDIPADKVYGLVHDYQINLNASTYNLDNIDFFNKNVFNYSFPCAFEDAVTNSAPTDKTMYPKAIALDDNSGSASLFEGCSFMGGFGMVGNAINVFGSAQHPAQFVFEHDGRIVLRLRSKRFVLSDNNLVSNETQGSIYLYDSLTGMMDSIYHNDLGFRYDHKNDMVLLYRKNNGVGTGPFHDTYHEFDIFLEAIYWNRGGNLMDFRRLEGTSGVSEGYISSVNYFRKADYLKIQALDMKHPMENIQKFIKVYGEGNTFNINDLATYLKFPLSQVTSLILNLQAEGYLEYDKESQVVTVLQRFYDVLESDHENFDYDVIKLYTRATNRQPNVRLVLGHNDMFVFGIYDPQSEMNTPSITLSDFKHVLILPDNGRIVLKRDRNFNFSGCIMAGMYEFFTKDCLFNYETFSINMEQVDSLRFYARFDGKVYPVEGTLERLTGVLQIDESDNKSSVRKTPDYPKFQCPGHAYKFYRFINGGVFDVDLPRDSVLEKVLEGKFYYCLDPFSVESLDNLNSKDISFKGRLVSGGIFEDIAEPLVVMEDHSLGFKHVIGDGNQSSYAMFGGKGGFHHEIFLSNEGFYGEGAMDVKTSRYEAPRFDFYLDSVTAAVQAFTMRESLSGTHFPKATCGPLDLKWDLTIPQLFTTTNDEPICLYDSTFFRGKTMLSDEGFQGDGILTFGLTRFESKFFDFDARSFVADSSDFVLLDEDGSTRAFLAENYRSHVDLSSKKVQFEYLDTESNLDFPLNKFYCSLQEAEWDMKRNSVHLFSPASMATSKFVSLLPEHDSLEFLCTNADYDMNEYVIHAHEVNEVRVADVVVHPKDANLDIMRNAEIVPLEHAVIEADTAHLYHHFKDASVTLHSRHDYEAAGIKDYLDAQGVATPVFFDHIAPKEGVTIAHATVADSMEFRLSPYFGFKGEVTSTATEPYDHYEGDFRLTYSCQNDTVWFASGAVINPDSVCVPVNMDVVHRQRQGLCNGLYYETGSEGGYKLHFMVPNGPEMLPVTQRNGFMTYDAANLRYRLVEEDRADQRLELSDRCVTTMHGTSNLGFDEGLTQFTCYGDYSYFPNDSMTIEVLNMLKVPVFDEQTLKDMADVYLAVEGEGMDLSKTEYLDFVRFEQGDEAAEELRQAMELTGYPEITPKSFYDQTIVIPSLKMVWNPALRAFVSVGKIGIGSLGKNVVNKYVDGYVVFDKRLGIITYFFQNDLFMTYISYNCGDAQLQVHATWGTVNARLSDMKEKSRSVKSGQKRFEYVVTPYEAITDFLSRLKRAGV